MCFHTRLSRPSSWHVPPFLGPNRLHARGWTRHSCSSRTPEVPLRSLCSLSDLERRGSLQTLTRHPAPCQRLPTLASGASIRHPVTSDTSNGLRFSSQRPTSPLIVSTFPTDQTRFERPAPIGSTAWVLGGLSNRMPHRPSKPRASFGVWIGPDGRYPTVGVSPTPRQVDLHECRLDVSGVQAYAVLFTLADSTGARTRYVSAYWPLEDGVWLSALGDSPESLGPTDFLFALRSMKVLRP